MKLLLGGDAMLGRGVDVMIRRMGPAYPLEPLARLTRGADLFFANLECAITGRNARFSGPPKAFYFRADPRAIETLTSAGVDLVSLANNHALDADPEGLRDTIATLGDHGIAHVGAGEDLRLASRPVVMEHGALRLGVLSYCDHPEEFAATAGQPGARYIDLERPEAADEIPQDVEQLASSVDHVIVAFHWQPNWAPEIAEPYRRLARRLVEAGARVIWGHSPHHFQGVEWIGGSAVLYSTGDLVDDYAIDPQFRNDRQLLFQLILDEEGVVRVRAYPLELEFARTHPAGAEAREWIAERFSSMCRDLGSRVERPGEWLEVAPGCD